MAALAATLAARTSSSEPVVGELGRAEDGAGNWEDEMQRENTDEPGASVGDLISKPPSKLRELVEVELDCVAGATAALQNSFDGKIRDVEVGLITGDVTQ